MSHAPALLSATALLMTGTTGSLHCAVMCGALGARLSASSTGDRRYFWLIHSARIIGYASLGAIAGSMGAALLPRLPAATLGIWIQAAAAILLISFGVRQWRASQQQKVIASCCAPDAADAVVNPITESSTPPVNYWRAAAMGLGWTLTPCPFKYSMLMLAGLAGNLTSGGLMMGAFALGSSPLLIAVGSISRAHWATALWPRVGATLMLVLGIVNLAMLATASPALASWGWCATR